MLLLGYLLLSRQKIAKSEANRSLCAYHTSRGLIRTDVLTNACPSNVQYAKVWNCTIFFSKLKKHKMAYRSISGDTFEQVIINSTITHTSLKYWNWRKSMLPSFKGTFCDLTFLKFTFFQTPRFFWHIQRELQCSNLSI